MGISKIGRSEACINASTHLNGSGGSGGIVFVDDDDEWEMGSLYVEAEQQRECDGESLNPRGNRKPWNSQAPSQKFVVWDSMRMGQSDLLISGEDLVGHLRWSSNHPQWSASNAVEGRHRLVETP